MSLKQRTFSGFVWSFIDNFAKMGIAFVVGIILARLLTPREFGLIGMTTIFIAVSQSFIDSGFKQALIRKKNCTQADFATVFYFNFLISLLFYGLLFVSAELISRFFTEPQLTAVIRVSGLILIVNGLSIVQQAQLAREINFKLQTKITAVSAVVSGVLGISLALADYGVWSLVATTLSAAFVSMALLWVWNGWRPSLIFSGDSFRDLFSFGSRMLASGLIDTIYRNVYLLVIGRFFSAADLGYYTRADSFNKIPSQNMTDVVQRVSYPALSTLQDDTPRLRSAYQKLIKSIMLIAFTLMLGMAAVAEPLILTLIGEQWQPSIIYLQLLCFVGMFYPLQAINLNMLKVKGRSDLFLNLEIVKKSLAVPVIIIGIYLGIEAMLVGMIVNSIIAYYINSYWSGKLIGYSTKQQVRDVLPSFTLAAVVSGIVYLVGYLISSPPPIQLVLQLLLGGCLTIGAAELLRLDNYLDMKLIVLEKLFKRAPAP